MDNMIRVLHITGNMNMGGQETFIMNLYRNIDRSKIQFDFVVHSQKRGYYDDEIEKMGGKIYRILPMSKNIFKYIFQLKKILKTGNYSIIHRHTSTSIVCIDLIIAKLCNVKKRIVHAHANSTNKALLLHKLLIRILNKYSTQRLACSKEAGEWLFGNKKDFQIVQNAIEIDKFIFNENTRMKIREQNNATNKKIIGQIGRLSKLKNYEFTLELFECIKKEYTNYELWIVGDGELKDKIKNQIENKNLEEKVKFFGTRKDTNELLQGMDVFVFPSIKEGLGIALIEAQIAGLPCIVSKNIQDQAIITNNVVKEDYNIEKWKNYITSLKSNTRKIDIKNKRIQEYSMANLVKTMMKIYEE